MMSADEYNRRVLAELVSIKKTVESIERRLSTGGQAAGDGAANGGGVADDRDLNGPHGDPTIKYDPKEKYWTGRSYAGYRFSETEPDYLDAMAKYLDACAYMGAKDPDEKKRKSASYKARDAARARGWAVRLRNGWQPPAGSEPAANGSGGGGSDYDDGYYGSSDQDEIPFSCAETRWWKP